MKHLSWIAMIAAFTVTGARAGDDAAIYGPDVPADAAFVRIISTLGAADVSVTVDGAQVSTGPAGVTAYEVVSSGDISVASGDNQAVVPVEAGRVYSIAVSSVAGVAPTVFEDVIEKDPSKAMIAVYNLSSEPVSVAALAERVPVLEPTAAGGAAHRAVNAVVIDLFVESSAATIEDFPQFALQAKTIASFFVFGDAATLRVASTVERTNS